MRRKFWSRAPTKKRAFRQWEQPDGHGVLWYKADPLHPCFRPDVAIILVHGILAGPKMWSQKFIPRRGRPRLWQCKVKSFLRLVRRAARFEVDVLAFRYPAWPFLKCSNSEAAWLLKDKINSYFGDGCTTLGFCGRPIRHLYFIAHSNGGLVIKQMLDDEGDTALALACAVDDRRRKKLCQIGSITLRSRRIVNLCVPHFGGKEEFGRWAERIYRCNKWLCDKLPVHSGGQIANLFVKFGFGLCDILHTLGHENPALRLLHQRMLRLEDRFETEALPFPRIVDYVAAADFIANGSQGDKMAEVFDVEKQFTNKAPTILCSGSHSLWTLEPALIQNLAKQLKKLREVFDHLTAWATIEITHSIDCQENVREMLGAAGVGQKGQQTAVLTYLRGLCRASNPGSRQVLLTGRTGVGKTRMLARLGRELAVDYLGAPTDKARPVYYAPLRVLDLRMDRRLRRLSPEQREVDIAASQAASDRLQDHKERARSAGRLARWLALRMVASWVHSARLTLATPRAITLGATVRALLHNPSYVLMLDGADDFLSKNPEIRSEELGQVFTLLSALITVEVQPGQNRLLIVSSRSRATVTSGLAARPDWTVVEVERLTRDDVRKLSTELADRLDKLEAEAEKLDSPGASREAEGLRELVEILSLPVIACPLARSKRFLTDQSNSYAVILDYALEEIIDQSPFPPSIDTSIDGHGIVRDLLTIIARLNYGLPEVMFGISALQSAARELKKRWQQHFGKGEPELHIFDFFDDGALIESVLRTVFQTFGGGLWTYSHRVWEEFLVARYYMLCVKYEVVSEFGEVGYLPDITYMTGDLLAFNPEKQTLETFVIPARLIDRARQLSRSVESRPISESTIVRERSANPYFVCNALAISTWNEPRIKTDVAAQVALVKCAELPIPGVPWEPPTADISFFQRMFVLNGMLMRKLPAIEQARLRESERPGAAPESTGAMDALRTLVEVLRSCLKIASEDPISASLSWCYLRALENLQCPGLQLANEWPEINGDRDQWRGIEDLAREPDPRKQRSLQLSLVKVIAREEKWRPIPTAHYLFILAVLHRLNVSEDETSDLLEKTFAQNSPMRALFMGDRGHLERSAISGLPWQQLRVIFEVSATIYHDMSPIGLR